MILDRVFVKTLYMEVLETFLENPSTVMSISEISRKLNKNVGSIFRIIPELKKRNIVEELQVSPKRYAYRLNLDDPMVVRLYEFYISLRKTIEVSKPR
ncbi:MAG: hypothetical protein DRJ38_02585 [Thermoprotei archaeon]|nr:MAG: hypothetical protein DRJ38_02585 [Thermoprotei archaeon]